MNRLDEALARLERAVVRLETALIGSGGDKATSDPVGPGVEAAARRLERGALGGVAGALTGEETGAGGRGIE